MNSFSHFNSHVLASRSPGTDAASDTSMILDALHDGYCFIGYDLSSALRGFHYTANGMESSAQMIDEPVLRNGNTFQMGLLIKTERMLNIDGKPLHTCHNRASAPSLQLNQVTFGTVTS